MSATIGITLIILILIIITLVFAIHTRVTKLDMMMVKSDIDGDSYLVRDTKDKKRAANLLASIKADIMQITDYMYLKLDSKNKEDIEKDIKLNTLEKQNEELGQQLSDLEIQILGGM